MSPEFNHELNRLTEALRRHRAVAGLGWGLVAALGSGLVAAIAGRVWPLWYRSDLILGLIWILLGGALAGVIVGYSWPCPLMRRLRMFDQRLELAERLTTTWELAQATITAPPALIRMQQKDALDKMHAANPQTAFPARLPRVTKILSLVVGCLLIPMLFLANPQEIELAQREAQQQATAETIAQLEATRDTLAQAPLTEAEREAALKALDEALKTLKTSNSTPEEQLAALEEAERQLAELQSQESENRVQNLAEAAPLSMEDVVQPLTEALQQGNVEAAAAYLRDLADPTTGTPLTAEEVAALADAFNQLADDLQESDPELAQQFRDIAQEIYQGDAQSALEAIEQAADSLSEVAEGNASNQSLEQAQAGLQQAQEQLGGTQQTAQGNSGQQGQSNSGTNGGQSNSPGQGNSSGQSNNGQSTSGHHEDSGSGAPYGPDQANRLEDQGGEISIPRQKTQGDSQQPQIGLPNSSQVPYRDVYADYAEAAEATLSRNAYPPALRGYVREYFGGLEP